MTKNKSIKVCKICGKYEGDTVDNKTVTFEKHRNVCRICRNKYHKNRRKDLEDGERDASDWYKFHEDITNARIIERLQKKVDTKLPKVEYKKVEIHDSAQETRYILYTFIIVCALIIYTVVKSIAEVG